MRESDCLAELLPEPHKAEQPGPQQEDRTRLRDGGGAVLGDHRDAAAAHIDSKRLAEGITKERLGRSNGRQYVQGARSQSECIECQGSQYKAVCLEKVQVIRQIKGKLVQVECTPHVIQKAELKAA